ncbi:MAG: 3'-5' exonuclease, partial [Candidatus Fermentibacteria bacterium]
INLSTKITPGLAKGYISRNKNEGISPSDAAQEASSPREVDLAAVYSKYQERLKSSGAFDFDDLLTGVLSIFRQNSDIKKLYSSRFSYILVDEYQDTNKVQHELLKELAGEGAGVCVVGDDDQSIYAWRGACVENILEFSKDFPGTRIIRLEENYRSSGNILRGASSLVNHNFKRHGKTLWTKQDAGHPITVRSLYNDTEEAEWILKEIMELLEDGSCSSDSIAVLYRTNAQSLKLETACRKHNIHYEVVGSQRFYERMEIKDIIAYLRVVINHEDRLSLERIINKPPRGLGAKGRASFFAFVDSKGIDPVDAMHISESIDGITSKASKELKRLGELFRLAGENDAGGSPASETVDGLIDGAGLAAQYNSEDITDQTRLGNIAEFRKTVLEYDQAVPGGSLHGFMTDISLATTVDDYEGENSGKIALMTLHCAKGLEFNVVFIAGLEEGMLPFVRPGEYAPVNIEEERRLLYVGMTRARERLLLTCAMNRIRGGVSQSGPSRFITEIAGGDNRIQPPEAAFNARTPENDNTYENDNTSVYRSGNVIRHPRYGRGLVKKAVKNGSEWRITVDFGFDEPKTLVTGYVPIPVIKQKGSMRDLD